MLVEQPAEQIGLLMLLGVLINVFASTQDVAVDGMAIDLTPVAEQGRLDAFMTFGKAGRMGPYVRGLRRAAGDLRPGVTAMVAASVAGLIWVAFAFVLEREGERSLPWGRGEAVSEPRARKSFSGLFKGLNQVLVDARQRDPDGGDVLRRPGQWLWPRRDADCGDQAVWLYARGGSQLVAMMGLSGAVVALVFGPMIDRFGAKRMLFATVALVAVHAFLLAQTQILWKDTLYVKAMLSAWIMLGPVTMVCMIALAMTICASVNSATQFAIYMSIANLVSIGSKVYGMVSEQASFTESYLLLGALAVALLAALSFHRHRHPHERDRTVTARTAAGKMASPARRPRATRWGSRGQAAGMYWSGAMGIFPKCRADMETLTIEGVEIDRCTACRGLWFDPGEAEKLRSGNIAAAIDTGDAVTGRALNANDRYRCPRCGGRMLRTTDAKQTHIWYEECAACHGSYFDAGEFTDLATLSVSDLFKRFATPQRG